MFAGSFVLGFLEGGVADEYLALLAPVSRLGEVCVSGFLMGSSATGLRDETYR